MFNKNSAADINKTICNKKWRINGFLPFVKELFEKKTVMDKTDAFALDKSDIYKLRNLQLNKSKI